MMKLVSPQQCIHNSAASLGFFSCFIPHLVLASPPTQPAQLGCLLSAAYLMFSLYSAPTIEEYCKLVRGRISSSAPKKHARVWSVEVAGAGNELQFAEMIALQKQTAEKLQCPAADFHRFLHA